MCNVHACVILSVCERMHMHVVGVSMCVHACGILSPRFAECRFAECRFAEFRFAECRFAETRFAEPRFAESRFAESRFAESRACTGIQSMLEYLRLNMVLQNDTLSN